MSVNNDHVLPLLNNVLAIFVLSTDYVQEQEMEIEALQAILMDDFKGLSLQFCFLLILLPYFECLYKNFPQCFSVVLVPEIDPSESGLNTSNRCFQITLSPQVHTSLSSSIFLFWVCFSKGIVSICSHEISDAH